MKRKLVLFVDDEGGYKMKIQKFWKKMWVTLSDDEQKELDGVFDRIYHRYCDSLKNK